MQVTEIITLIKNSIPTIHSSIISELKLLFFAAIGIFSFFILDVLLNKF